MTALVNALLRGKGPRREKTKEELEEEDDIPLEPQEVARRSLEVGWCRLNPCWTQVDTKWARY